MMIQNLNDNFIRSTHTFTVRSSVPRQMFPIKKLNISGTEWSLCGSFEKGEIIIALTLDYCQQKTKGSWAGLYGEILNKNGYLLSRMTKMYFVRPGQILYLNMRLFPENYYKRRISNGSGHLPKSCIYVRITTTLAHGLSRLLLENFLALNNTILQTIPWPEFGIRAAPGDHDCTIVLTDGLKMYVHKATILAKLDKHSPMHHWHARFPESMVFFADMDARVHEKTVLLFHQLVRTNYMPWKKIESTVLHELLHMAKYFRYSALLRLCGVQLIHMLREYLLLPVMIDRLARLQLPFINGIIDCHQVTSMVQPEVGTLFAARKEDF